MDMKLFTWAVFGFSAIIITLSLYGFFRCPKNMFTKKAFQSLLIELILGIIFVFIGSILTVSTLKFAVEIINDSIGIPILLFVPLGFGLIIWACGVLFLLPIGLGFSFFPSATAKFFNKSEKTIN